MNLASPSQFLQDTTAEIGETKGDTWVHFDKEKKVDQLRDGGKSSTSQNARAMSNTSVRVAEGSKTKHPDRMCTSPNTFA